MKKIPNIILKPQGVLQDIVEYIDKNSAVSIPFFNLGAALTLLGSVCGQKIQTETGLRTNLYSIALGYSGTGKNAPFSSLPNLLLNSDAQIVLGPTELTSAASILKWLSTDNQQIALLMLDEIGLLLSGIKNQNSFASDLPRMFIKLFSSTNRGEIKGYATGLSVKIPWHHLSFFGASTPERFWESITMGDVTDGFLARILLWENHDDAPMPKNVINFSQNNLIKKQLNKIFNITKIRNGGQIPTPKVISKSEKANIVFQDFAERYHDLKNKHKTNQYGLPSIYGRAAEHVSKIALLHTISKNINGDYVRLESVEWAINVIDYILDSTITQIKSNISENETDRSKQKILKWISENDNNGVKMRDIQRHAGRGLLVGELKNIVDSLLVSEELMKKTVGRSILYFIN